MRQLTKSILIILILSWNLEITGQNVSLPWAAGMGSIMDERGNSLAIDSEGNTYITGSYQGIADFDPGPGEFNLNSKGQDDIFVQKMDKDGNFIWAVGFGDGGDMDRGNSIAIDKNNDIYITGSFQGTVDFDPGNGEYLLSSHGGTDFFILKLDADANLLWAVNIGGEGYEYAHFITTDASGSVYITGSLSSFSIDFDPGPGSQLLFWNDGVVFILKLDASANFTWAKNVGGKGSPYYFTWGKSICLDNQRNVYLTGVFGETSDFDPGNAVYNLTSKGNNDLFILKLDASGNFIWAKNVGSVGDDRGESIKLDHLNHLYICGSFRNTADFDPGPSVFELKSEGQTDIFTLKLDVDGNFIWAKAAGSWDYDYATSMVIDPFNDIYITGGFNKEVDFDPNSGIYSMTSSGSHDVFLEKLSPSGDFIWAVQMGGESFDVGNSLAVASSGSLHITGTYYGEADFDPNETANFLTSKGMGDVFVVSLKNITMTVIDPDLSTRMLWPNPSDGLVHFRNFENLSYIAIYDLSGKIILEKNLQGNDLSLISLSNGVYFARITTQNQHQFTEKVIVINQR